MATIFCVTQDLAGILYSTVELARRLRAACDRLSALRRLAADSGFDFRRETDSGQWLIPFTYRRLPVLCLHALELELPHHPPERAHYVGPMLLESRDDDRTADPVEALLARGPAR